MSCVRVRQTTMSWRDGVHQSSRFSLPNAFSCDLWFQPSFITAADWQFTYSPIQKLRFPAGSPGLARVDTSQKLLFSKRNESQNCLKHKQKAKMKFNGKILCLLLWFYFLRYANVYVILSGCQQICWNLNSSWRSVSHVDWVSCLLCQGKALSIYTNLFILALLVVAIQPAFMCRIISIIYCSMIL